MIHSLSSVIFEFLWWFVQDSFPCLSYWSIRSFNPTGDSWRPSQVWDMSLLNPFSRRISSVQKSIACHQFNLMKDKHTINLILISSKWVILSFRVCSWWINSSSKCFHFFFSGVQISSAISSVHPSESSQGSSYSFILHFISSSFILPEYFMVVLHDLILSPKSSSSTIPSSQARVLFPHVSAGVLPKAFQSYSFLIWF